MVMGYVLLDYGLWVVGFVGCMGLDFSVGGLLDFWVCWFSLMLRMWAFGHSFLLGDSFSPWGIRIELGLLNLYSLY